MDDIEEYVEELQHRCGEMSFLIGMMHVGLVELGNQADTPEYIRSKIKTLLDLVNDKVVDLFYKDETREFNKTTI